MAGQIWSVPSEGGYLYSDELSTKLRMDLIPIVKFRQFCDAKDGTQKGLNRGEKFRWNKYSKLKKKGGRLSENQPMPETGFTVTQAELTIVEMGNSVPYTGKLDDLSLQDVVEIIDKTLRVDAREVFDIEAFEQFNSTPLRVVPASGTSSNSIELSTNGVPAQTNNIALGKDHVKAIIDTMKMRNIPPYMGDDYMSISHASTYRPFKNDVEQLHVYTETGIQKIFNGEIGRYEGCRFVEQSHIPTGGAADSTSFDPWSDTGDPWNNAKSSWAYFFGMDTVTEAIVIPEEIRAKIPGDYGRSRGIAWYYMGGFGLVHSDATNARVLKWDSAT